MRKSEFKCFYLNYRAAAIFALDLQGNRHHAAQRRFIRTGFRQPIVIAGCAAAWRDDEFGVDRSSGKTPRKGGGDQSAVFVGPFFLNKRS